MVVRGQEAAFHIINPLAFLTPGIYLTSRPRAVSFWWPGGRLSSPRTRALMPGPLLYAEAQTKDEQKARRQLIEELAEVATSADIGLGAWK